MVWSLLGDVCHFLGLRDLSDCFYSTACKRLDRFFPPVENELTSVFGCLRCGEVILASDFDTLLEMVLEHPCVVNENGEE